MSKGTTEDCPPLVAGRVPCLLPIGHKGLHECVMRDTHPLLGETEFDVLWSSAYITLRDRGIVAVPGAEA